MKRQALMMLLLTLAALASDASLTARRQSPATDQQSFLPPTSAFIGRTAQIPMRDGQSLAADIYLPKVGGKHPVVLIQTPYNKTPMRSWWQGEGRSVNISPPLQGLMWPMKSSFVACALIRFKAPFFPSRQAARPLFYYRDLAA